MALCPICHDKPHRKYRINKYQYYECRHCAALFLYPMPSLKTLKRYYHSEFQYSAGLAQEERIRKRANLILKNLKQMNPKGRTLLDIGSGYGYFLDEAKKSGLKTYGIEPSKRLLQSIPVKQLTGKHLFNGTFQQYIKKTNKQTFDFIIASHVIEHMRDPLRFIRQANQLMNRNGIFYIETPNYSSWLARSEKEHYTFLTPPDHIWLLSSKSLQLIVVRFPELHIESVSTYSHPEHLMGILKKKLQMTNNKLQINCKFKNSNNKTGNQKLLKKLKYGLFDKLLAPIFTPLLNIGIYGSILELYIAKK